ncbi:MAG TPA: DnaJ domain-containing protein [Polyangia bacterium]|nr:DnaJ domain-containing protein [Polyangia bacterium]
MATRRPDDLRAARADHYAVLGLATAVSVAEIRRAYRQLALRYHPDRAGPNGTAHFQRIAEAYRVLSDPAERSRYDAGRNTYPSTDSPRPVAVQHDFSDGKHIERLCGPLDVLIARSAAAVRVGGGVELYLTTSEARRGGIAAIGMPLRLPCPTCGGVAAPHEVWCVRCEFAGSIVEEVSLRIPIPAQVKDGTSFTLADPMGIMPASLRVRIRVTV